MKEISVNIREFKSRLSHYLRLAKSGQPLEIRERETPIGRIIPMTLPIQERLEAMARSGLLLLAKGRLKRRKPVAKVRGKGTVADLLVEDRG
jgi:antitoxin (DNA-binding transcriptional repressor) of toxin-antitoxin stability system